MSHNTQNHYDAIIIGAGAAGLFCAMQAGQRGKKILVLDHAKKLAEKIRISGGGRCNFTNIYTSPENFLSQNPHFCKSALKQYSPYDFIDLVAQAGIGYHEKTLGQQFCDNSAQDIISLLLDNCASSGVKIIKQSPIKHLKYKDNIFICKSEVQSTPFTAEKCVIATGGLSIPKIGASKFGYDIAKQFGHSIIETRPALVPLTFQAALLEHCKNLSGLSVDAVVSCGKTSFREGLLFTHRGLSGPSILQISSYWREGEDITVNLAPAHDVFTYLKDKKQSQPKQDIKNALAKILPSRLAEAILTELKLHGRCADINDKNLQNCGLRVNQWRIKPSGTEGYRTAEVTLGGVNTNELSSQTMESKLQAGLYFIGEVIDVTGHLGGFNFQWAWASAFACAKNL